MPQENKYITSSTNEFEFGKIITNRIVFAIPYFQRSYVWNKENLEEFHTDILELEDNSNNIAFMGAIILYRRPEYQATQATFYDVIDGQQRIITMTLYIIALADKYVQLREFEKAAEVLQVLFNTGRTSLPSNIKIYPCGKDIPQFNNILKRLFQNPRLSEAMEIVPKYLPDHEGGSTRGKLATQYGRIKQKVGKYETIERLEELTSFLTDKVNFVQLDLNEPNDATKVFERLNFRGVQVTVGDLVRNEIFVDSYTTPPDELTQIYLEHWIPFYQRFGSNEKDFESFLFGSALIHDSTINKSGIYTLLRGEWEDFEFPSEKIEFLKKYLEEFCEIKYGNSHKDFSQRIKDSLNLLRTAKVADVVHPFLMKVLYENDKGNLEDDLVIEIINLIESYVVRRGLCGHEQTGMYKIFVSLWKKTKDDFTIDNIRTQIASYTTQPWPNNDDLKIAIYKINVSKARVLYHVLNEFEHSLDGDIPQNSFTFEHILPQSPSDNYPTFNEDDHEKYCHILANLIPVSGELNSSIKNAPYAEKQERYARDSMFKSPRNLAENHQTWNSADLDRRTDKLYKWIKNRWKY